ncbi:MAG: hypothetical protein WDZ93_04035 [Candidatus Paceibacterota bacterium]
MHSDWETFIKAYETAPTEVRTLLDSETIPDYVSALVTKHQLDEEAKPVLIAQLSDIILSLLSVDDFLGRATKEQRLSEVQRDGLAHDIKQFLGSPYRQLETADPAESTVVDDLEGVPLRTTRSGAPPGQDSGEEAQNEEQGVVPVPEVKAAERSAPAPEEPPADPFAERVTPLRTMQSDANRIHGYGAYRRREESKDTPETKEKRVVEPPRYSDNENG